MMGKIASFMVISMVLSASKCDKRPFEELYQLHRQMSGSEIIDGLDCMSYNTSVREYWHLQAITGSSGKSIVKESNDIYALLIFVKGQRDATILLKQAESKKFFDKHAYEIVIGSNNNTQIEVRNKDGVIMTKSAAEYGCTLSPTSYLKLDIRFKNTNEITIAKHDGTVIMSVGHPNVTAIDSFGFRSDGVPTMFLHSCEDFPSWEAPAQGPSRSG